MEAAKIIVASENFYVVLYRRYASHIPDISRILASGLKNLKEVELYDLEKNILILVGDLAQTHGFSPRPVNDLHYEYTLRLIPPFYITIRDIKEKPLVFKGSLYEFETWRYNP